MRLKILSAIPLFFIMFSAASFGQNIPSTSVIPIDELTNYINASALAEIDKKDQAGLAAYFRQKFSDRFFYD